jgi:hypothetical protein
MAVDFDIPILKALARAGLLLGTGGHEVALL